MEIQSVEKLMKNHDKHAKVLIAMSTVRSGIITTIDEMKLDQNVLIVDSRGMGTVYISIDHIFCISIQNGNQSQKSSITPKI